MSKYDTPENMCIALTVFITEIREQAAAIRAYDNVFQNTSCANAFMQRAYDSIWRELLSEVARIFDKANTGSSENCSLLRLKELCCKEQYSILFPNDEKDNLRQSLDAVFEYYNKLPINYSRRKQLAHHDLKQVIAGECIGISLEQIEQLITIMTDAFIKIYTRVCLGFFEISFPNYDMLVKRFEDAIKQIVCT